ncbi:MAG TPA: hypothetical protein PKD24_03820 [Pyrinomonadaceae bacterium]|nr:hypothetical protein [Pyrinomonadaceae bacterium]HMP64679.1 hypothetical protein [Pyrinomonadaceae bacterium]
MCNPRSVLLFLATAVIVSFTALACSDSGGVLGFGDETSEAELLVIDANKKLAQIREMYRTNENLRTDLANAVRANDAEQVRTLSTKAVQLINDGTNTGREAIDLLREASEKNINPDFKEYLRLKEESILKQMEAFARFHRSARVLRDNYDPKDTEARETVQADFADSIEEYRRLMEEARSMSWEANELYKKTVDDRR